MYRNETLLDKDVSDDFGEFKFDGISPNSGPYRIEIEYQAGGRKQIEVVVQESCSVGTVWL